MGAGEERSVATISQAESDDDIGAARALFLEYAQSLDFSLCFQGFDEELAALPGCYAAPSGRLLLAHLAGAVAGCVGVRDLGSGVCEMKRLYVRPEFRGKTIGRALAEAALAEARAAGYERMRLDTIPSMEAAIALYEELGFGTIAPDYHNPIEGATYMEIALQSGSRWIGTALGPPEGDDDDRVLRIHDSG